MKNFKKLLPITAIATASVIIAPIASSCSCGSTDQEVKVQEVKFNQEYSWVQTDSTRAFGNEVKVLPENATNKSLSWKISDESSAKVAEVIDENTGTVKGLSEGYAKLTCTSKDGSGKSSEQWIVVGKYVELTGFSIESTKTIELDTSVKLKSTYTPADATTALNEDVLWSSSDANVVEVDQKGNITAKAVGTATITAIPYDWDYTTSSIVLKESLKSTCDVTVNYSPVEEIVVTPSQTTKTVGDTFTVTPTILPSSAKQDWGYIVLNEEGEASEEIVSYNKASMTATANKVGKSSIVFYSDDEQPKYAACSVTVQEKIVPVEDITIEGPTSTFYEGNRWVPTIKVLPEEATEQGYWLESSNPDIAYIDTADHKTVVAKKEGKATITVHSNDGEHSKSVEVTVVKQTIEVQSVEVIPSTATCTVGKTIALQAKVLPENATDKSVTWKSDAENIATVDANGVVSGIAEGTTTITATSNMVPTISASCTLTVKPDFIPISSISIPESKSIDLKESFTLSASIEPSTATSPYVGWYTSDESIVTVENGVITGKGIGTATIYAYALDGSGVYSNPCDVTVDYSLISNWTWNCETMTLIEGGSTKLPAPVFSPETACQDVTWKSSNPLVALIDQKGHLNALKEGKATITWTAVGEDHSGEHPTKSCNITVLKKIVHVSDIELSYMQKEVLIKEKTELPTITFLPYEATERNIGWTVSDPENVKFVEIPETKKMGFVCRAAGSYTIKCTPQDNPSKAKNVEITALLPDPTSVEASCKNILDLNEATKINYKVLPTDASQAVTFVSSNPEAIKVDEQGNVTGLKKGNATITVATVAKPSIKKEINVSCNGYVNFTNDTWENVCKYISEGKESLHKHYSLDCERNTAYPGTLIGYQKTIKLNGLDHHVRVIDEEHDNLADGSGKALLTFEMVELLSGGGKQIQESRWVPPYLDRDYFNSILIKNLTGKGGATEERDLWKKTALTMFKEENSLLFNNVKTVRKQNFNFVQNQLLDYDDQLFILTNTELTGATGEWMRVEGTTYKYWQGKDNPSRIKKDLSGEKYEYWTSSVDFNPKFKDTIWAIDRNGNIDNIYCDLNRVGVSFAFCI